MAQNSPTADRNLLFGILALQMDFINRDQLVAAMNAWVLDKQQPLGQVLLDQRALESNRHALLDALVQEHLKQHDNDPQKSLAAVSSIKSVREELHKIADADVQASLVHVSAARKEDEDPYATLSGSVGTPTSSGLRFRVLRPHARGGLGQVYVAHDEELHREVALKEIQERHADHVESRSRFVLEAEITGGLEHPGIVPVYGLGQYADGRPFYAMRFIRGDSLKDAIERFHQPKPHGESSSPAGNPLELRQLLGRFIDVCNAIQYAHDRGVLHRDLKPGNIMLGKYGETLVVDWGLAKALGRSGEPGASTTGGADEPTLRPSSASGSAETVAGRAMGTPQYMSPEQAAGRLDQLGPASDVYSLGATLYCLLTGKAPFGDADVGTILQKVQRGDFQRPRAIKPETDPALEAICLKAMSVKSADRYPSPRTVAYDLEQWLADEPVSAWPEPWTVKSRRWIGQHRTLVTGTTAALLVGVVSLVLATVLLSAANKELSAANLKERDANQKEREAKQLALLSEKEAKKERDEAKRQEAIANQQRSEAEKQKRKAEENETKAEWRLYASHIASAQREWEMNRVGAPYEYLASCRENLRGWEHDYLYTLFNSNQQTFRGHRGGVLSVALSPDGKKIVSGSLDRTLRVWETGSGREALVLNGHTERVTSVAFSPDGKKIVSGSNDKTVRLWHAATGKEAICFRGHSERIGSVAFSPDGNKIISGSYDRMLKIWDAATGREILTLKGGGVQTVAVAPDGTKICDGNKIWDAATGRDIVTLKRELYLFVVNVAYTSAGDKIVTRSFKANDVWGVAFSPDGKKVVSGGDDKMLRLWDSASGQEILTLKGHTDAVTGVAFSPDGNTIISGSMDQTVRAWDSTSGEEIMSLKGHTMGVTSVAFGPDGRTIVSGDGNGPLVSLLPGSGGTPGLVKVWDFSPSNSVMIPKGSGAQFGRDGQVVSHGPRELRFWNGAKTVAFKTQHTQQIWFAALSPDGKKVVIGSGDKTLRVWDISSKQEIFTLKGHQGSILCATFSPDGSKIVSGSTDKSLKIWDSVSGQETLTIYANAGWVGGVAFSPNGKKIASVGSDKVKLWDVESGQEELALKGHTCVAFSPDGKRIVSGGYDKLRTVALRGIDYATLKMWDATSGQETLTLEGHKGQVKSVAFSPDGKRIVSSSTDRTLKLWDAATGQETMTVNTGGYVTSARFSPDGKRIVSSGNFDDVIDIWDAAVSQGKKR